MVKKEADKDTHVNNVIFLMEKKEWLGGSGFKSSRVEQKSHGEPLLENSTGS